MRGERLVLEGIERETIMQGNFPEPQICKTSWLVSKGLAANEMEFWKENRQGYLILDTCREEAGVCSCLLVEERDKEKKKDTSRERKSYCSPTPRIPHTSSYSISKTAADSAGFLSHAFVPRFPSKGLICVCFGIIPKVSMIVIASCLSRPCQSQIPE